MASGYTTVKYGNVWLFRCTTRGIMQEPMYDPSGTNMIGMRTTIDVSGYLNGRKLGLDDLQDPETSTGNTYQLTDVTPDAGWPEINTFGKASIRSAQIRRNLGPRKKFTMLMGDYQSDGTSGEKLFEVDPSPDSMIPGIVDAGVVGARGPTIGLSNIDISKQDINNGPRCTMFRITNVTGDELYTVDASFEICLVECDPNLNAHDNQMGILSNRWSCVDQLDSNLRTTRSYSGYLRVASQNINLNQLRTVVLPPIVPGFRRDSFSFQVAEDGLSMNWNVTDIEIAQSPPWPARTWSVTHAISNQSPNAFMGLSHVDVDLTGDTNVNKTDLIELALYIITAKACGCTPGLLGIAQDDGIHGEDFWKSLIIKSIEFVDYTGDVNRISARATVWAVPAKINPPAGQPANAEQPVNDADTLAFAMGSMAARFGRPIVGQDVNTSSFVAAVDRPPYRRENVWGGYYGDPIDYQSPATALVNIFLNYYQTPCNDAHYTGTWGNGSGFPRPGNAYYRTIGNLDDYDRNPPVTNNVDDLPPTPSPSVRFSIYSAIDPTVVPNRSLSESNSKGAYIHFRIDNIYKTKTMRVRAPRAKPINNFMKNLGGLRADYVKPNMEDTTSIGMLAGPQGVRVIRIQGERIGEWPQFPCPETLPNFASTTFTSYEPGYGWGEAKTSQVQQYCLRHTIRPRAPIMTVTGDFIYAAEAEYVMALSRPLNPDERLHIGNEPWLGVVHNTDGTVAQSNNQLTSESCVLTATDWTLPPNDANIIRATQAPPPA